MPPKKINDFSKKRIQQEYGQLKTAIISNNTNDALRIINACPDVAGVIDDFYYGTPLIMACNKLLPDVAMALIATGKSNTRHVNKSGNTALMEACLRGLEDVAMELIDSYPECVNENGFTALINACRISMNKVALALISTGKALPGHADKYGDTALTIACSRAGNKMNNVALALIATGESNPGHVTDMGYTALIYACKKKLDIVAMKLIATRESNPKHITSDGHNAYMYAVNNNMDIVAYILDDTNAPHILNSEYITSYDSNQLGYNMYNGEEVPIMMYNGLVFKLHNKYYLISEDDFYHVLNMSSNNYFCSGYQSNPHQNDKFVNLKLIIGLDGLVMRDDALSCIKHYYEENDKHIICFEFVPINKSCRSGNNSTQIQIYAINIIYMNTSNDMQPPLVNIDSKPLLPDVSESSKYQYIVKIGDTNPISVIMPPESTYGDLVMAANPNTNIQNSNIIIMNKGNVIKNADLNKYLPESSENNAYIIHIKPKRGGSKKRTHTQYKSTIRNKRAYRS